MWQISSPRRAEGDANCHPASGRPASARGISCVVHADRLAPVISDSSDQPRRTYSYLGPAGTFTEAALAQVPDARGHHWNPVRNVGEALADVVEGRSDAAMIAIEN